jgi:hypothetical protein
MFSVALLSLPFAVHFMGFKRLLPKSPTKYVVQNEYSAMYSALTRLHSRFLPCSILKKLSIYFISWQLNIAHNRATDKAVLH